MIRADFSTGGFVLHQIPFNGGKLSAWFDDAGNLLDVERFNRIGKHAAITEDTRKQAAMAGRYSVKTGGVK